LISTQSKWVTLDWITITKAESFKWHNSKDISKSVNHHKQFVFIIRWQSFIISDQITCLINFKAFSPYAFEYEMDVVVIILCPLIIFASMESNWKSTNAQTVTPPLSNLIIISRSSQLIINFIMAGMPQIPLMPLIIFQTESLT